MSWQPITYWHYVLLFIVRNHENSFNRGGELMRIGVGTFEILTIWTLMKNNEVFEFCMVATLLFQVLW